MKTAIATVSISGMLPEKLRAIASAGFDGIEIFEQDFIASDFSPREVGRMVRDHGLEIMLFQPFRDFETLPDPLRRRAFARAERKFDLMAELEVDLMLVCSSVHPAALGGVDRAASDFRALGEIAATRGIRVGYEALCWGRFVRDHRDAWEIVRRADHPNIGLILDSFHTLGPSIDPETIREIPGDRIFFVQLADAPRIEMDLLYWSRHFRNMPGEGDLDVPAFMRAVMATGYAGPISLEIFNDQFRSGLPRLVANDGKRSLIGLMDQVRREEPDLRVSGQGQLPPPIRPEDVEYIEIATDEATLPALTTFLTSAGFAPVGRHRSKPVTRWQQGRVNIVLNTGKVGFNYSSWVTHGTAVSEIGIRVPDAADAVTRALALMAESHGDRISPGDPLVPAVRGVGGTVLRFVDDGPELKSLWEREFIPCGIAQGSGITHTDHIAQTMAYEEMLSASLFYSTLFEVERMPMLDVVDPDGLVRSQAIISDGLRITLNGAEARRTLARRFIDDTFGASVQHIALASNDIFVTAEKLAERGFPFLGIGANYYAALAARFDLKPDFVDRLRRLNIMYDEDGMGSFFQFYSTGQAGELFFEIVQRQGGYEGYGAPNAPFRIAAQKRHMRPLAVPEL
ncbi:3-keto-5-aminohexanoate cleavage protein [Haematobacter missouriensis]|uniref:3-dehydroshikimate dehydratase n=1 Tax=Haematobacter missouriensis TaxID=366616 RepID=A0A212AKT1_9RHOB|nr:sugar phosphate isomerase/epimerase and 4-hydroxyphenylpyruvate domain-containing protein [Haematobacter missouriensis]KFI24671.1 3-keto-5-aminohexanoate cleavage protein [Haematobacter missouriensis]OWJ73763.1 3-keto-5-aminohexanoate cleavage protein [Haematobacter missouriensis]OWJ81996.1 3-keto-5-aminohexanoate cleavage protein [Haematobacter missouriensis]